MSENIKQQIYKDHSLFEAYSNLWTLPRTDCSGIEMLKSIANSINNGKTDRYPSILIVGDSKDYIAQCFVNSIQMLDIRICDYSHFEAGTPSFQFFDYSSPQTAHIIQDIENQKKIGEAYLWKYLSMRCCPYTYRGREPTIIHLNGIIILTAKIIQQVPDSIYKAIDHACILKQHTKDYLIQVIRQYLNYFGIEYTNKIIETILKDNKSVRELIQVAKTCIVLMKSEQQNKLSLNLVYKAIEITGAVTKAIDMDEIPF